MKLDEIIAQALEVLKKGGVILYPTDTVWGIGCDATNEAAVQKVFAIKRRSEAKSLVLLACDLDMICRYVKEIPQIAIDLVEVNDAPMTIVYPGAIGLAPSVVAEDGSVGIRIPLVPEDDGEVPARGGFKGPICGASFCRELVRKLRRPLVSTSANISGEPAPVHFADVSPEISGAVDFVVPVGCGDGSGRSVSLEYGASGRASQIIKLGLRGEVEIIRK